MADDALAPCVTRSSADMILTVNSIINHHTEDEYITLNQSCVDGC